MIFKTIFMIFFILLFIYSLLRPFSSIIARLLTIFGSVLGALTLVGIEYTDKVANFLGIGRGPDLYLYIGLFTFFLYTGYSLNKFDILNRKISDLVKQIAINEANNKYKKD